ncbi:MAG TPA: N-acyl homoserine lactonase family protein [Bosea sp. (in: a-proteobacteria)]|uniref:N-acyl homoserine lactonase family protein n=1 Tax=Bosea sp. (in: a-proteobacteria) TaxID=1871050 RepID=UPI002E0FB843|nr:N-acyl homoserine lactonase family protein [Bosea sp. (in: a-proteobacteria)]
MQPDHGTTYEVYAIRYATNPARTRNGAFIRDPDPTAPLGIDFYFWVAVSGDTAIVIDTGMAPGKAARQGHTLLIEPLAALQKLGIAEEAVKTVIMTHLHYDHTGNTDAFANATFHLQAEEMAFATGPLMEHGWLRHAYHADEIQRFVGYLYDGRLRLHGRDAEIADGISVHWVGGHCAGQEIVRLRTHSGWLVLASDALHYKEELTRGVPYALAASNVEMLAAHRRIRELAGADERVIAGHDPELMDLHPSAGPGLEGIAIRVDLPAAEN